jgi:MarR family 2-MHQ and catechol resistance regulon transcriptional repressor
MPTHYRGPARERRALEAYIKLMRAADSVRGALEDSLAAQQLTENQFGALETVYHLGAMPQFELSRKLFTSRGNLTVLLDQLERRDLVRRVRGTTDRRSVSVHLSDAGRALVEDLLPTHVGRITELFGVLEEGEQTELARLCKTVGLNAREISAARPSPAPARAPGRRRSSP